MARLRLHLRRDYAPEVPLCSMRYKGTTDFAQRIDQITCRRCIKKAIALYSRRLLVLHELERTVK